MSKDLNTNEIEGKPCITIKLTIKFEALRNAEKNTEKTREIDTAEKPKEKREK